jgi:hypothetical protein
MMKTRTSPPGQEGAGQMEKKINYIIREVPPEHTEFSFYFEGDGLTEAGGDYCYNLFIVAQSRRSSGFNEKEYQNIQNEIENLLEMYEDIVNKSDYAQYSSVGAMLLDLGLINSIHNTRRIKEITEWLKACLSWGNTSQTRTLAEYEPEETTAEYLTFKTGKEWTTDSAYGYCQGDYVEMVYCPEHYTDGVKHYGEIWLGAGKEFSITFLNEAGEEDYTVYGYIVADSQAWKDEDYKKLICEWEGIPEDETQLEMIDGCRTYTKYSYRTA